jgi:tetratricopeptide (TPR) repeat protein
VSFHDDLVERLAPEVKHYTSPRWVLRNDLERLLRVHRVQAPEATIFYCARTLEALTADALDRIGLRPGLTLFGNLALLEQFDLIPPTTRYWAHALRRLGNDVRHLLRLTPPEEEELALLFAERWLEWFFRHYPFGPRLESVTTDRGPLGLAGQGELRTLIEVIDAPGFKPLEFIRQVADNQYPVLLRAAALPAALAEMVIAWAPGQEVAELLGTALAHFPEDRRLQQLMGLYWSRTRNPERALEWLRPLYEAAPEDDETTGILAGVYKKHWEANPAERQWLFESYRTYRDGWRRSRQTSTYLGINAAATALWLGQPAGSRQIAAQVRQLLHERAQSLSRSLDCRDLLSNYWQLATLAEAELLLGNLAEARRIYQEALARHPEFAANVEVSLRQAERNLRALGLSLSIDEFLRQPSATADLPAHKVAVTGHRVLPADPALQARVREVIERIRRPGTRLVLLSPLAEGADRLVAEVVLRDALGVVHVLLPLELTDYRNDFEAPESQAEFQALLDRAEAIVSPSALGPNGQRKRPGAYERCGQFLIEECAVVIALWDGQPARGPGGTAEVVAYARQLGRPLAWIGTELPYSVVYERFDVSSP